jgi:hypothetical protein
VKCCFLIICSAIIFVSCHHLENKSKNDDEGPAFFDYKIKGNEKDSLVTVYLQFKMDGPNGMSMNLNEPEEVTLDGEKIPAARAKLTGAYYEIQKPANGFTGSHTIIYTDAEKKQYKEEFEYRPFSLQTEIPAIIHRGDIEFSLDNVDTVDYIRVTATDTSFRSRDIIEIDTARNGRLIIPSERWNNLVNGPIILMLSRERERPVKNGTVAGGRIVVSYGMEREFELQD